MKFIKQPTLLLLMLLLSLTLGGGSKTWAQQDSTKLELNELKQIAGLLVELQEKRDLNDTWVDKEIVYKGIIKGYQNDEELYKQKIANLNANIEAVTPSWYDNFWVGSAVTAIVISSIYLLAR